MPFSPKEGFAMFSDTSDTLSTSTAATAEKPGFGWW
jgi:hypothetical protein